MSCGKYFSFFNKFYMFFIFISSLCITVKGQDYIWPTDASRALTSTFAEYRPGRFHAGIDIKTWGKTGYKIFAVGNGYISRLRISPFGYGKSLYLTLDSGETVVYAHLDGFNKELEDYVWAEQEKRGRYSVQLFLPSSQFRFKQGDFLGFTGQTGIGSPHLHFEMRDENEYPINPFLKGYQIEDHAAPTITRISLTPLNAAATINNDWKPIVLPAQNVGQGRYVIEQPVTVSGLVGFGLSAFDTMENISNKFGTYTNQLFIDDKLAFSSTYDKFSYDDNYLAVLDREFRLAQTGRGNYYKLYLDDGNSLPFYAKKSSDYGTLFFQYQPDSIMLSHSIGTRVISGKEHTFRIEASDFWGNTSAITGRINVAPTLYIESTTVQTSENNPFLEIPTVVDTSLFTINSEYYDNYLRLEFIPDKPLQGNVNAVYQFPGTRGMQLPLVRKNGKLLGCVPLNEESAAPLVVIISCEKQGMLLQQTKKFIFQPVLKYQSKTIFSDDELCQIEFSSNSLFRPVFVRISESANANNGTWKIAGKSYHVEPGDVALNKGAVIKIKYDDSIADPQKLGIYYRNVNNKWVYFGNILDTNSKTVGGYVGTFGTHALVVDDVPPSIMSLYPLNNAHVQTSYPQLRAVFKDTLSGIQGEDNMQLLLDGHSVIAEYDPERLSLTYKPRNPLLKGQHTLEIFLKDNCGNIATKKNVFWVD